MKYADQGTCIELRSELAGRDVDVYVVNQGRPIPEDVQKKLFQAFVTGAPPEGRPTRIPSTGLGLTFCKLAAEAHGGSIWLESPVPGTDRGVSVRLRLPHCETLSTG